jgi:ABC-type sugar transport system, ATPase component
MGACRAGPEETLAAFKLDVPVTALTGSLSLADRQLLEVAKALLTRPKVLLLDEPTTALGPGAVQRFHDLVHEQAKAGVGIVYVSHRLPEVLAVADRVTVLRDGIWQGTFEAASVSEDALVALMIGRPLEVAFPGTARASRGRGGHARRVRSEGRALRPDRSRGPQRRDPRDRGSGGQRPGAVPAGARRRRARDRQRVVRRREDRHALAGGTRSAQASSCSAATGAARPCSPF